MNIFKSTIQQNEFLGFIIIFYPVPWVKVYKVFHKNFLKEFLVLSNFFTLFIFIMGQSIEPEILMIIELKIKECFA